jgi:hypothetical protein
MNRVQKKKDDEQAFEWIHQANEKDEWDVGVSVPSSILMCCRVCIQCDLSSAEVRTTALIT